MLLLAKSTGIRIFAVLLVLALRPLLVASVSVDHGRTNNPAIRHIADDGAAHLTHSRRVREMGPPALTAFNTAVPAALLIKLPEFFAARIDVVLRMLEGAVIESLSPRAPPL